MRHIIFHVEKDAFALPLAAVREVVMPPTVWSKVPRAPAPVRGVMNLRGRVVTVVELHRLLRGTDASTPHHKIVLLDRGRRDLGLLVTEVDGIESIERILQVPGHTVPRVRGSARVNGLVLTVLDAEEIDRAVAALFVSS